MGFKLNWPAAIQGAAYTLADLLQQREQRRYQQQQVQQQGQQEWERARLADLFRSSLRREEFDYEHPPEMPAPQLSEADRQRENRISLFKSGRIPIESLTPEDMDWLGIAMPPVGQGVPTQEAGRSLVSPGNGGGGGAGGPTVNLSKLSVPQNYWGTPYTQQDPVFNESGGQVFEPQAGGESIQKFLSVPHWKSGRLSEMDWRALGGPQFNTARLDSAAIAKMATGQALGMVAPAAIREMKSMMAEEFSKTTAGQNQIALKDIIKKGKMWGLTLDDINRVTNDQLPALPGQPSLADTLQAPRGQELEDPDEEDTKEFFKSMGIGVGGT